MRLRRCDERKGFASVPRSGNMRLAVGRFGPRVDLIKRERRVSGRMDIHPAADAAGRDFEMRNRGPKRPTAKCMLPLRGTGAAKPQENKEAGSERHSISPAAKPLSYGNAPLMTILPHHDLSLERAEQKCEVPKRDGDTDGPPNDPDAKPVCTGPGIVDG